VLENTVDVEGLRAEVLLAHRLSSTEVRRRLRVGTAPVFATIGGLDDAKRVDLIAGALDVLWARDSPFQLVVGGSGVQAGLLERAERRGQVRMLGSVDAEGKALIARVATALLNPGRVGLIAVESMAMSVPIITTVPFPHAPEFEYLRLGIDSIGVEPTAEALADAMIELATNQERHSHMVEQIAARADDHLLSDMVQRMFEGIMQLVDD
jgi:glycosyltransferase involved in cell wall biosynthesis